MRLIQFNEPDATRRQVFFHVVQTDGISPALNEGGGQPQVAYDGGDWTDTGIGTLAAMGFGRYFATLTQAAVEVPGVEIETRYGSGATAETPGDSVQVVGFDPAAQSSGSGSGSVAVDQDYGGTDALTIENPGGSRVDGATIRAYRAADYAAGQTGPEFVVAQTLTDVNGHWAQPLLLDPESYTLLIYKRGVITTRTVPLTVS